MIKPKKDGNKWGMADENGIFLDDILFDSKKACQDEIDRQTQPIERFNELLAMERKHDNY